ncbi:MAG: hypothetical protein HYT43_01205 [Candidatus Taylorbacteria bacterium]|nr:hypothetical protein [Candidatus Taylorbacteria bacterium]
MKNKNKGQAILITVILFVFIASGVIGAVAIPVLRHTAAVRFFLESRQSFALAESAAEDAVYRLKHGKDVPDSYTLTLDGNTASISLNELFEAKEVVVVADVRESIRKLKFKLDITGGASFFYAVQAHTGGLSMMNNSSIKGNAFANGPVTGANSNLIKGDIVSAGPGGLIDGVHATGSAFAHTIKNSTIDKDAHYEIISNTTVGGVLFPNSPDLATSSLSITDEKVAFWENLATSTVISNCPDNLHKINTSGNLGPVKIQCDLEISGNVTVTLQGHVWVLGDITIRNNNTIRIDPAVGQKSLTIIADKPSDQLNGSKISVQNSTAFEGSGEENSYILVLSQNKSAESGGAVPAITSNQSSTGDALIYAGHGEIVLEQSSSVREVSGYKLTLKNSTEVVYATGLTNVIFTSGPGGGYKFGSWGEI